MRQDQIERLKALSEQLADRFLMDADPTEWPCNGHSPADLTPQQRGDATWCRKMAMATGGVLRYALDLTTKAAPLPGTSGSTTPEQAGQDADLDRQIRDAERRATEAVNRVVSRAKKNAVA